jgi:hypothetical protein
VLTNRGYEILGGGYLTGGSRSGVRRSQAVFITLRLARKLSRMRWPNEAEDPCLCRSNPGEVGPSLGQAERIVRTASHLVRVMIVLAVVVPKANWAYLVATPLSERDIVATRTLVRSTVCSECDVAERLHAHTLSRRNRRWGVPDRRD